MACLCLSAWRPAGAPIGRHLSIQLAADCLHLRHPVGVPIARHLSVRLTASCLRRPPVIPTCFHVDSRQYKAGEARAFFLSPPPFSSSPLEERRNLDAGGVLLREDLSSGFFLRSSFVSPASFRFKKCFHAGVRSRMGTFSARMGNDSLEESVPVKRGRGVNERKREAHRARNLGLELIDLNPKEMKKIARLMGFSEELVEAIALAKSLSPRAKNGWRRQVSYVAGFLRSYDSKLLEETIDAVREGRAQAIQPLLASKSLTPDVKVSENLSPSKSSPKKNHKAKAKVWLESLLSKDHNASQEIYSLQCDGFNRQELGRLTRLALKELEQEQEYEKEYKDENENEVEDGGEQEEEEAEEGQPSPSPPPPPPPPRQQLQQEQEQKQKQELEENVENPSHELNVIASESSSGSDLLTTAELPDDKKVNLSDSSSSEKAIDSEAQKRINKTRPTTQSRDLLFAYLLDLAIKCDSN